MYNQGIHDCSSDHRYMLMWNATVHVALKGSHEVGLCILVHLKEIEISATAMLAVESGQNQNIYLVCILFLAITTPSQDGSQTFIVSGHSYHPNDRDFSHIEQLPISLNTSRRYY